MDNSIIMLALIALLIGVIAYHISESIPKVVPYSVILLLIGFTIGGINVALGPELKILSVVENLDPHLFMQLFLPSLLFYSVFSINYHTIMRLFWQSIILAFPGVLINACLTALVLAYIIPYHWNFITCLIFGAVISATDPVAVVTLLREMKAAPTLSTLIEAESLFNDSSAIILFNILILVVNDRQRKNTAFFYFWKTAVLLVSPAFGILCGLGVDLWAHFIIDNEVIETAIIFVTTHLLFYFAELVHSSGVLAIVSLGLFIARNRGNISAKGLVNLGHFWELLEFFAKTLIFIISGALVAYKTIENDSIRGVDFAYLLAIYLCVHVTRAITLLLLHPFLVSLGNQYGWKTACVLWYGSLRGAIGLSLALIVEKVEGIPGAVRDKMSFLICGIVILSLIINATTIRFLLKFLNVKGCLHQSDFLIKTASMHLKRKSQNMIDILRQNNHFTGANWSNVQAKTPDFDKFFEKGDYNIREFGDEFNELNIRYRIMCSMKSFFWKQHSDGLITTKTYNMLYDAAESVMDHDNLDYFWLSVKRHFKIPLIVLWIHKLGIFKSLTHIAIHNSVFQSVQLLTSFIFAADRTGIIINKFPEWKSIEMKRVETELQAIEKRAIFELNLIKRTYPEVYNSIQTHNAIVFLLNKDIKNIKRLKKDGIIQDSECEEMSKKVLIILHKLKNTHVGEQIDSAFSFFKNLPFFSIFDSTTVHQLFSSVQHRVYSEDDFIYRENTKKTGFFIIVKGIVEVKRGEFYTRFYGPGATLNLWATASDNLTITSCKCSTAATVLKVTKTIINEISRTPLAEEALWKSAGFSLAKMLNLFSEGGEFQLGRICHSASFLKTSGAVTISAKVILLKGDATDINGRNYKAPSIIEALNTESITPTQGVTINEMRVEFSNAVALVLDGKGGSGDTFVDIVPERLQSDGLQRQVSLGLIFIKGSNESNRVQLQALPRSEAL